MDSKQNLKENDIVDVKCRGKNSKGFDEWDLIAVN